MAEVIASLDTTAAPATAPIAGLKHRYILLMLLGAYTLSFLDRQVVTILAEPIKTDLVAICGTCATRIPFSKSEEWSKTTCPVCGSETILQREESEIRRG